jgi:hypothetical protein
MTNEIIFKTRVDTGTTSKDLASISTELGKIDEGTKTVGKDSAAQLEALNAKIKAGGMSARELSRSVQEYMTIARDAGRNSPVGQQAIAEAAKLTDELTDLRNEIKRASHDGANMQAALQLGSTVIAGYGAAKGAMSLLGVESESLQESMVKLQAATATLNGLEQIRAALEKESFLMQKAKIVQTKVLTGLTAAYSVAVGSSTGALKLFRLALIATGIGAIVVGIGMLVANFDKLAEFVRRATSGFQSLGEKTKLLISILIPVVGLIRATVYALEQLGIIQTDTASKAEAAALRQREALDALRKEEIKANNQRIQENNGRQKTINETYDFEIAKAKAAGKDTADLERKKRAEMRKTLEEQIKNLELSFKLNMGNLAAMRETMEQIIQVRKQLLANEKEEQLATISEGEAARKKAGDAEKERLKKEEEAKKKSIEYKRALEDYLIKSLGDSDVARRMQIQLNHQRELDELTAKYGKESQIIKDAKIAQAGELAKFDADVTKAREDKENADAAKLREIQNRNNKAGLEAKLLGIQDDWAAEMEVKKMLWEMERDQALQNTDLTENEKLLIKAQYTEKLRQLQDEDSKRTIEQAKQEREALENIYKQGFTAIQGISDAVFANRLANAEKGSKEELEIQKKQFKLNKAMQLSAAVIDGFKAITASLAQSPIAIGAVPNPAGIASLAFAAATSAANVAKIAATRFDGGGGSIDPPTIPQVGAPDTTNVQPQAQGTQTAGLVNKPNKVVVVDSEIKAVMDSSQQIEVVSSFGG